MVEMDMYKRDAYLHQLERVLDQDSIGVQGLYKKGPRVQAQKSV